MTVHAFVDESRRNDTYYLASAVVDPRHQTALRRRLRGLLLPGQRELHFKHEKPERRRAILSVLVGLDVRVDIYGAGCRRDEEGARRVCLTRLVDDLLDVEAGRLVLDSRSGRDEHDVHTIRMALGKHAKDAGLTYEHFDSTGDPLLWLADIAAWSHGAGGDWARRVEPIIGSVIRLDFP
ncbi:hypothetical protein K7G98_26115 [Saccharothrix sp. MB29]|nr:hypothetical protein [Saccharothrix sp. MB29]